MYWIVVLFIIALDQGTKSLALRSFRGGVYIKVVDGLFYFTYLRNAGNSVNILLYNINFRIVFGTISIVFILYLLTISKDVLKFSLCLILGGCISNIAERVLSGSVVDFLAIPILNRPFVFNIADTCIYIGALIAVYCLIVEYRKDNTYIVIK